MSSNDPTHLKVVMAKTQSENTVTPREIVIEGWSKHVLLLQDLRLLISQINDASAASSASTNSSTPSPLLVQTRWLWMKKYASEEQYSTVRKILKMEKEKRDRPVWGLFATTPSPISPEKRTPTSENSPSGPPLLKVAAVTYNVAGCSPPTSPRALPFLYHDSIRSADILVVGLQEMDHSSAAYVWFDSTRQDGWVKVLLDGLHDDQHESGDSWRVIAVRQHVTILGVVLQRVSAHVPPAHIDEVSTASVGVGLGGMLANKGAVGVRMRVKSPTSPLQPPMKLCIIIAHLSAGTGQIAVERRTWDWTEICKRIKFRLGSDDAMEERTIEDHTHCVLLGDLNSRLPLSLSSHSVQRLIRRGVVGLKILRDYDELRHHLHLANSKDTGKIQALMAIDETALLIWQGWKGWKEKDSLFAPTVSSARESRRCNA